MLKFEKMTNEDLELVRGKMINDYAKAKIEVGVWSDVEALELAKETFETLLKKGVSADKNYFYQMFDGEEKVGYTWFALPEAELFLYTVSIYENYKNKEYEKKAMETIEHEAKILGAKKITAHIFGQNDDELNQYKKFGYHITDITVCKKI
jgi:ribosomal protein S18 acetylase RimI-like enzyme